MIMKYGVNMIFKLLNWLESVLNMCVIVCVTVCVFCRELVSVVIAMFKFPGQASFELIFFTPDRPWIVCLVVAHRSPQLVSGSWL